MQMTGEQASGCTSDCEVSYGWHCKEDSTGQSECTRWGKTLRVLGCGDGYLEGGEECDDYWWDIGNACVGCKIQTSYACSYYNNGIGNVGYCWVACGDNNYQTGEECDLGSSNNG